MGILTNQHENKLRILPLVRYDIDMNENRLKVLFVCSHNQWRSPTAEKFYARDDRLEVRSAGTSSCARHTISIRDVKWADLILCMESKHVELLKQRFSALPEIESLDISNEYHYGDLELIEEIYVKTELILEGLV